MTAELERAVSALAGHSVCLCGGGRTLTGDGRGVAPLIALIDSGAEAANLASTQFDPNEGTGTTQYFVSDDPQGFDQLAELFLQEKVDVGAELVDISRY